MDLNTFNMQVVKGMVDLRSGQPTLSAQVDDTAAIGGLVPGQAVKIVTASAKGIPRVIEVAADSDDVFGFVVYDQKDSVKLRGDRIEIMPLNGGIMYMEANAAILRNAEVAVLVAGSKVITATATDRIIGRAIDGATAGGQLIRVAVQLPGAIKA